MKLIIQIPCFNEEHTLRTTLSSLPRELPGVDKIEWLVIDDGSTDKTVEVAFAHGVDHIVQLSRNQGLAQSFMAGIEACLKAGADIIVNTDADNQYCASDIPNLINPILSGKAEIVIGSRPIDNIEHFSFTKKLLQKLGSWIVRLLSKTDISDVSSGFRAISRSAAMQMNVFSEYTYTHEMIIQAGQKNMAILSVPIRINDPLRQSRLFGNVLIYILKSFITIIRIFIIYCPFPLFAIPGLISFSSGFLIGMRFLYYFFYGPGTGRTQSLILAALLMGTGFFLFVVGIILDSISANRKMLEDLKWRIRHYEAQWFSKLNRN
jgi:glycosyltransferase involved in cell wall biosynthesis